MTEESFILVNLKEGKAKKLAQVISNETSRKILDFLAKKEATESDIAKELNVPISTVHYSLTHLKEVNLVQCDEFHYSQKGKVVEHYKLSNKMVIIAPHNPSVESIKEKLMKLFPAALVGVFGAGTIFLSNFLQEQFSQAPAPMLAAKMMDTGIENVAANSGALGGSEAMMYATRAAPEAINQGFVIPSAVWFLAGAVVVLAAYLVTDIIRAKMKEKKENKSK
jgi:DNA-binding transcriptional ArsR family regulator